MHPERSCAVDRRPFSILRVLPLLRRICRPAVVKEPVAARRNHTLNEYNVWHLPDLFPFFFGCEDRLIGTRDEFGDR